MEINLKKVIPIGIGIIVFIILLVSWNSITVTIGAGEKGVLFRKFGKGIELDKTYGEGLHLISPWNRMYVYEVRQQEVAETMNMLSSNGLEIMIDVSAWYRPSESNDSALPSLHANIGEDYLNRVVIPSLRSSARSVIGRYTPEQIYSTKRDAIQDEIFDETKKILDTKNVSLEQVLIRSVKLPQTIKESIENKLKQEQLALEYEFKLETAKKEAERQRIEAEGKARANDIINASLTKNILKEKGIEATLKLSQSNNTKVVVVGSGEDGLPIILGGNN